MMKSLESLGYGGFAFFYHERNKLITLVEREKKVNKYQFEFKNDIVKST